MSISGNGKSDNKPDFTGGSPKPKEPSTGGGGEESPQGESKVILIADPIQVRELAGALRQKPFKIIADLMEMGVFENVLGYVKFQVASKVAGKYGYKAEKIG
jgi:translation initiation factor IF-2